MEEAETVANSTDCTVGEGLRWSEAVGPPRGGIGGGGGGRGLHFSKAEVSYEC